MLGLLGLYVQPFLYCLRSDGPVFADIDGQRLLYSMSGCL
jgi:hypothetical protein